MRPRTPNLSPISSPPVGSLAHASAAQQGHLGRREIGEIGEIGESGESGESGVLE